MSLPNILESALSQYVQSNGQAESQLVEALKTPLDQSKEAFKDQSARQKFVEAVTKAVAINNGNVKGAALECIAEFMSVCYQYVEEFYIPFWKATSGMLVVSEKNSEILVHEIWIVFAEGGSEKIKTQDTLTKEKILSITGDIAKDLLPLLLQNLSDMTKYPNDDDNDSLSVAVASQQCLSAFVKVLGDSCVIEFVTSNLTSADLAKQRAALTVFTALLDSRPNPNEITQISKLSGEALSTLVKLLKDGQTLTIQVAAARVLQGIADAFPEVYTQNDQNLSLAKNLSAALELHPKVAIHIANFWFYFAKHLNDEKSAKKFNIDVISIIDLLIKTAIRGFSLGEISLADSAFLAVQDLLLLFSEGSEVLKNYIYILTDQYKKSKSIQSEKRDLFEESLLSCLQTALHKFIFTEEDPIMEELFNISLQVYKTDKVSALLIMAGLAQAFGSMFDIYSEEAWACVTGCPEASSKPDLFEAVLNTIVELASACPEGAVTYLGEIIENLLQAFQTKNVVSDKLKPKIILTIGDIALGCKEGVASYADKFSQLYELAIDSVSSLFLEDDPDAIENIQKLRENTLESYTCFFHSISDTQASEAILNTLPKFCEFLSHVCAKQYDPTIDFLVSALNFFADVVMVLGPRSQQFLKKEVVFYLLNTVKASAKDQNHFNSLNYAITAFRNIGLIQ